MYPSKVDLSKEECRGALRRLELEAYSSVVSTFRAQGNLDSNKQTVLDQLRRFFKISEDRHKAEIRRVANNEKLTTISELINGKSYDLEWIKEGHRSYPLISRATSCTALHILADHASKVAAFENTELPAPSETRRERNLDVVEIFGKPIVSEDPTKPPQITSPTIFGMSRKELKRSIDLVTLHPHSKKKHYHHLKPPPPAPHVKIQHLYQTLNTKRPRKSFTKKSKTKATAASTSKQSPSGRTQFSYPTSSSSCDEQQQKHFDGGVELQRHLTSQLMPPPPMKLAYTQQLPSKKEMNLLNKMNHHQSLEPQAHYIPNNRLKSELLSESTHSHHHHHHQQQQQQQQQTQPPIRARSGRSKSMSASSKSNYNAKYANGAGSRLNNSTGNNSGGSSSSSSMDHIPDPQIIFNTTSSKSETSIPHHHHYHHQQQQQQQQPQQQHQQQQTHHHHHQHHNLESGGGSSSEIDLSPAIPSPLQLLSTAASCTPKLKVTATVNHPLSPPAALAQQQQQQQHQTAPPNAYQVQPQANSISQLPSPPSSASTLSITPPSNILKTAVQNRAIKIIPASTKPVIIKPQNLDKSPQQQQQQQLQQQQTLISNATPSKFKIQKIQLVMNKNQDGSTTNISPSATIVSGKAGQLMLSGKGITNTYQVSSKATPYTILSSGTKITGGVTDAVSNVNEKIPENQRITENTPVTFLPVNSSPLATSSAATATVAVPTATSTFPKVIIQKSATAPKQIKLKLGPGSIVNSKIIKGPLPGNLKIQRNINTKGFTVLNTSQLIQIQTQQSSSNTNAVPTATVVAAPTGVVATTQQIAPVVSNNNETTTKTDWEQELDDANRTKKSSSKDRIVAVADQSSNGNAKKPRLDEAAPAAASGSEEMNVQNNIEPMNVESNLVYAESLPQIEVKRLQQQQQKTPEPMSEFVYIGAEGDSKHAVDTSSGNESMLQEIANGEGESTKMNGQFEEVQINEMMVMDDDRPHNGAEAYENLVKSLEADCESEYMKEMTEEDEEDDSQIDDDNNFRLIDSNMLDPSIAFSRESERIFQ